MLTEIKLLRDFVATCDECAREVPFQSETEAYPAGWMKVFMGIKEYGACYSWCCPACVATFDRSGSAR